MDNEQHEIEQLIKEACKMIQPRLIEAIRRLVAIYSVEEPEQEGAPFGEGPKRALHEVLSIAEELGFHTVNLENKVGYAQYGDSQEPKYIGIFGHVDIVPIGEGWTHDPLGCEQVGNRLYGRGVLDNKGPILSNLFALYILKELGVSFPCPIRIIFGANEETGFRCMHHYLSQERPPLFGWTPDCKWPVVYGERGRLRLRLSSTLKYVGDFYRFLNNFILSALSDGRTLGINFQDEDFGTLQMRGYRLFFNRQHQFEWVLSYPASCTTHQLIDRIMQHLPNTITLEVISSWDPVLYDRNSPFVQTLQQVYNDCTGLSAEPVTTTGGTYAKIVPNIIAYGPSYPGQVDIAHLPDEWIDLDDLQQNTLIYALALWRLKPLMSCSLY